MDAFFQRLLPKSTSQSREVAGAFLIGVLGAVLSLGVAVVGLNASGYVLARPLNVPPAVYQQASIVSPTPTYGYAPKVKVTLQLVQSWCINGDGTTNPCDSSHFKQIAEGVVLYTTPETSHEYFNIHEGHSGVIIARLYRGGGFKGFPYWDITSPPIALWSGQTILFTDYIQLDQQGRIVSPELPEGTQP